MGYKYRKKAKHYLKTGKVPKKLSKGARVNIKKVHTNVVKKSKRWLYKEEGTKDLNKAEVKIAKIIKKDLEK